MSNLHNHPFHLVENRPWPIYRSLRAILLTSGLVSWFHTQSYLLLSLGLTSILLSRAQWWRDVSREASLQGLHTFKVTTNLRWGIILFILSEILFFFSFFWAFFHTSLNPTLELGAQWPPTNITPFNPFQIPLLNTAILLSSAITVTWAHHAISARLISQTWQGLFITIALGLVFSVLQGYEYLEASFTIADSAYGSSFFVATGFHGLHVLIGTTFLIVCLARLSIIHFSSHHHIGLEAAIWYWHFVDVVWLFLFVSIYWWGN